MLVLFHKILYALHTKDKNLQEILSPSLFPREPPSKTNVLYKNVTENVTSGRTF